MYMNVHTIVMWAITHKTHKNADKFDAIRNRCNLPTCDVTALHSVSRTRRALPETIRDVIKCELRDHLCEMSAKSVESFSRDLITALIAAYNISLETITVDQAEAVASAYAFAYDMAAKKGDRKSQYALSLANGALLWWGFDKTVAGRPVVVDVPVSTVPLLAR